MTISLRVFIAASAPAAAEAPAEEPQTAPTE
jgi:hypothetical protein